MCADAALPDPPFPLKEAVRVALAAPTPEDFYATPFYCQHGAALEEWLHAVRSGGPPATAAAEPAARVRLVQWNIQQGKAWDRILAAIEAEPRLREADLWTLNEVDIGMARSENRDVCRALADQLGMHWVFAANYLELTKGLGADRLAPGENQVGLHGCALFSRWPLLRASAAELPECHDYFRFREEKRYGCRRVLWAIVAHPMGEFLLATTHLEVRNTPACRARQMAAALSALPDLPGWFTGDWNTNTFHRRSLHQQAREFLRLQRTPPEEIDRQLRYPWGREPLLRMVEAGDFSLRA